MKKLYEKCIALLGRIAALNVPLYASQASFFLALSVFPLLVLLMGLNMIFGERWFSRR